MVPRRHFNKEGRKLAKALLTMDALQHVENSAEVTKNVIRICSLLVSYATKYKRLQEVESSRKLSYGELEQEKLFEARIKELCSELPRINNKRITSLFDNDPRVPVRLVLPNTEQHVVVPTFSERLRNALKEAVVRRRRFAR